MAWPLTVAAIGEGVTGLALMIAPSLVGRLLFGEDLSGPVDLFARILGIALLALAAACWPGPPRLGMLLYGVAAAVYLAYLGLNGRGGVLLWPAVVVHLVLVGLLLLQRSNEDGSANRRSQSNKESLQ